MRFLLLLLILTGCTHSQRVADDVWATIRPIKYCADETEYWQTPAETIERGCGDCEDTAILAYFTLLDKGEYPQFVITRQDSGGLHMHVENAGYIYSNNNVTRYIGGKEIERFNHRDYRIGLVMERM